MSLYASATCAHLATLTRSHACTEDRIGILLIQRFWLSDCMTALCSSMMSERRPRSLYTKALCLDYQSLSSSTFCSMACGVARNACLQLADESCCQVRTNKHTDPAPRLQDIASKTSDRRVRGTRKHAES